MDPMLCLRSVLTAREGIPGLSESRFIFSGPSKLVCDHVRVCALLDAPLCLCVRGLDVSGPCFFERRDVPKNEWMDARGDRPSPLLVHHTPNGDIRLRYGEIRARRETILSCVRVNVRAHARSLVVAYVRYN